jgi:hypothetical protein
MSNVYDFFCCADARFDLRVGSDGILRDAGVARTGAGDESPSLSSVSALSSSSPRLRRVPPKLLRHEGAHIRDARQDESDDDDERDDDDYDERDDDDYDDDDYYYDDDDTTTTTATTTGGLAAAEATTRRTTSATRLQDRDRRGNGFMDKHAPAPAAASTTASTPTTATAGGVTTRTAARHPALVLVRLRRHVLRRSCMQRGLWHRLHGSTQTHAHAHTHAHTLTRVLCVHDTAAPGAHDTTPTAHT